MKMLWRLSREAARYRTLYVIAILSTLGLTAVNLAAPKALSAMTGIVERGVDEAGLQHIGTLTAVLVGLYLLRVLFRFLSNYLAHKAAWYLVGDLRTRTYDKLERMHLGYFHDKQTGDLMSRVVNDTRDFELLYAHMIPETIANLVTFTGVLTVLLTINAKLALFTCAPIPLILISGVIFSKKVRPFFRISQQKMGELNGKLQDNLSGIHEIQSFGREEYETEKVNERNFEHIRAMLQALKISAIFHPSVEFVSSLGTILVVGFGGYLAFREGLHVEDIVAFLLYLSLFYGPVTGLANLLENMQQSMAGAERVLAVLDTPCGIRDEPGAAALKDVRGDITFDHVSFSYSDPIPVLRDVSFHCEPGKMLALVGPTGVGKTTLTQLISRFYEPTAGRILIDQTDIRHVTLESLRQCISPVLQDTFLFNGTIAENIGYAVPEATMDEIREAAAAARIHEDILAMPDGYDTQVGERGLRLSGGQKQRVAIARAILRKSPIIILDEATASVDVETEQQIQEAVAGIAGTRTIIAIAHRLSTIRNADKILVIEDGKVTEEGTHAELVALGGSYARMNQIQSTAAGAASGTGKAEKISRETGHPSDPEVPVRTADSGMLIRQAAEILDAEPWYTAAMSNLSALLAESLTEINWAGFYLIRDGRLVVGPFQGKPACIHIPAGKGVCGTAVSQDRMQVVPDVHSFPGHIACDSASRSEIVIPIHHSGHIAAVLDIDSPVLNRFSAGEAEELAEIVRLIEQKISWN